MTEKKRTRAKCPICQRQVMKEFSPFCSERCRNEDLGNWLGGRYTIPTSEQVSHGNDNDEG